MTRARIEPAEAAHKIYRERYSGAHVMFLAGSVLRGEGTPSSDLDIVVVFDRLPHAYRESFFYETWPVEAFIHDPETINYFFSEVDRPSGHPALAQMVLEGVEIPAASEFSGSLKRSAAALLEAGPPPLDEEALRKAGCFITDVVDDIRHPRTREELFASGARLYEVMADFYFRSRNLWSAKGKTIPRRLRQVDEAFYTRFCGAFDALFIEARPQPVIALAEELLRPHGGFMFDGQRFDASLEWRQPLG